VCRCTVQNETVLGNALSSTHSLIQSHSALCIDTHTHKTGRD